MPFVPPIQKKYLSYKTLTVKKKTKTNAIDTGTNTKIIEKGDTATISAIVS